MRLIYLSLSWIAGIVLGTWAGFHWSVAAAVAGLALLALALGRRRALFLGVCLLALLGGVLRFDSTVDAVDQNALRFYNDSGVVRIIGAVSGDPEITDTAARLRLEAREVQAGKEWRSVSGIVLVYVPRYSAPDSPASSAPREAPYYRYGDLLEVVGSLETPPEFDGFDWRDYLARRGIHSVVTYPDEVTLLAGGGGFAPQGWLYDLRDGMSGSLEEALPEPHAALSQAILLGTRSTIPDDLRQELSRTGTAHIIAISGLHLTVFSAILLSVTAWILGRARASYFLLAVCLIWAYATFTGLHPPVMRAAIMVSLWLFAEYVGRPRSGATILCFAAAIMIGLKPSIVGEASFQMSFAAMTGLVLLSPHFRTLGRRIFKVDEGERSVQAVAVDAASVTLGAYLMTAPVIAYHFQHISLVALPANLAALPALPFAIGAAAVVGVVGLFASPLAWVLGWAAWLFISYIVEVVEFFSLLPFASRELAVGAPAVWVYYALVGAVLLMMNRRRRVGALMRGLMLPVSRVPALASRAPAGFVAVALLVPAVLVWAAVFTLPDDRLHVFVLDVGQGDSILISRGDQQVLVDGGADPQKLLLELGDKIPFWDRTIELVVLTHPEADHITGLVEVLRRYGVERVLTSGQDAETAVYGEWSRLIVENGIPLTVARAGQVVRLAEGVSLELLHPPPVLFQDTVSDINNNSVVARLVYGDFSVLLAGDIYEPAERDILDRRLDLRSTVLKVPHHGSESSTCPEFLQAVNPRFAVVSVAADNPFGHPDPEVVQKLTEVVGGDRVYVTSEQGTIELTTDGERVWVQTGLSSARSPADE